VGTFEMNSYLETPETMTFLPTVKGWGMGKKTIRVDSSRTKYYLIDHALNFSANELASEM
jgi:hypothetical protein